MKKILSVLLSISLCLLNVQVVMAEEQAEVPLDQEGAGDLTDYTSLFLKENPDALIDKEDNSGISVYNESGSDKNSYAYLAVFIEFPDMEEFDLDSEETISNAELFFNDTTNNYTVRDNGQTVSLLSFKSYIQKYSYGRADVTTYMFPNQNGTVVSYVAPHPQSYYKEKSTSNPNGYDNSIFEDGKGNVVETGGIKQQWAREFELLNGAVAYVDEQLSSMGLSADDIDINGDGKVDSISFFCEAGDYASYSGAYVYNSLLWSHKLSGCTKYMHTISDKKISFYNLILGYDSNDDALNGSFSKNSPTFGTVIHEFMHILGIPDMYRTSYQYQQPVGYYDVMATNNKVLAQPTLTYNVTGECYNLCWHDPLNEITETTKRVKIVKPNYKDSSEQNAIKIMVPGQTSQFFVAEYYDLPESISVGRSDSSGVILYRINTENAAKGNTVGYKNGTKDFLYVMRPGDAIKNAGDSTYLGRAVLNASRTTYGKYDDGSEEYDSESLYLADGTNSGIVVEVVAQDKDSVTININYTSPITDITCETPSISMVEDETKKINMIISPQDTSMSTELSWTSSDPNVATVDEKGNVTAIWKGTTTITATTINGYSATCEVSVSLKPAISVYRIYNEDLNVHRYSTSKSEVNLLVEEGWEYEAVAWLAPQESSFPVYRFVNTEGKYYYTMYPENVSSTEWTNEGIAFYSDECETIPIYYLKSKSGAYYYTMDFKEYNALKSKGWTRLGIAWYGSEN